MRAGAVEGATTDTVAMLFSDIEGSTRLLQDLGPAYAELLLTHQELLRAAFEQYGGNEVRTEGDAFFVTFERSSDAVAAALAGQRALLAHPWPPGAEVRVRMGIHTGEIQSIAGELVGLAIHAAARIAAAGHGAQVLVSQLTADLAGALPPDACWIDLGEHRLKDFATPVRVLQLGHSELPAEFPPIRSQGGAGRNNLPAQVTAFVGRDAEVTELRGLLAAARLVTVTGAGGAGKTRLALRVAAEPAVAFADGVWLIDLAPIADPAGIAAAVAAAMGLAEAAAADLAGALAARQALLVIDNCEHVIAAVATLVAGLLARCPDLAVLATSREPLGVPGEIAWRLPSMTTTEATALFEARAGAANPRFALTDENRPTAEAICARLDGIPLAIELAAARLASLGLDQLADRLDQRFKVLTGGSRIALARQRTLEATVDWSYRLLEEREQHVLARLGVFAGGFSLEAAEAVGADDEIGLAEVFDIVDALVAKSLIVAEDRGGTVRYRLLETIRQFALDRLADADATAAARDAHLAWVHALAVESEDPLWLFALDADERAITQCDREAANIRAALEWALETGKIDSAHQIATSLVMWWLRRGPREGYDYCDRVLAGGRAHELGGPIALGRWLLATNFENDDLPWRLIEPTREVMARSPMPPRWQWVTATFEAYAAMIHASNAQREGQALETFVADCRAAATTARESGIDTALAMALEALTLTEVSASNLDAARAAMDESLALMRRLHWAAAECRMEQNAVSIALAANELDDAWRHCTTALAIARRASDMTMVRVAGEMVAALATRRDDYRTAYDVLLEVADAAHDRDDENAAQSSLAWLAYLDGRLDLAAAHVTNAVAAMDDAATPVRQRVPRWTGAGLTREGRRKVEEIVDPLRGGLAATLRTAGVVARARGDLATGWDHLRRAAACGPTTNTAELLTAMGGVRVASGDEAGGALLLGAGTTLRRQDARPSAERRVSDEDERVAREILGKEAFDAGFAEGGALSAEDAIARALAMEPPRSA